MVDIYKGKKPPVHTRRLGKSKERFAKVQDMSTRREADKLAKEIRRNGNNARIIKTTWQGEILYEVWIGNKRK
jgi:hypothetical protein